MKQDTQTPITSADLLAGRAPAKAMREFNAEVSRSLHDEDSAAGDRIIRETVAENKQHAPTPAGYTFVRSVNGFIHVCEVRTVMGLRLFAAYGDTASEATKAAVNILNSQRTIRELGEALRGLMADVDLAAADYAPCWTAGAKALATYEAMKGGAK